MDRELLQALYRYCYCLTAHSSQAEDLLQTSIERWIKCRAKPANPRAYIRAIIRNQFIDDCRRLKVVDFESLDENAPALLDERCLEEIFIQHDLIEHLFDRLNAAEREVLYLWAVEGFSTAEIAEDLGQPRGSILSRLHRIKLKSVALELDQSSKLVRGQTK